MQYKIVDNYMPIILRKILLDKLLVLKDKNFIKVVDVGVDQKELIDIATAILLGFANQRELLSEFFPEGVGFVRIVNVLK